MGELREALRSKLEDIDRDLEGLEAVVRGLNAGNLGDPKDLENVLWHIARSLEDIRAQTDEATGMTLQMKTIAA